MAFDTGFTHYDDPPPDVIEDIEALRKADRFRFANVLSAWMEADAARDRHRLRLLGRRADGLDHGRGRRTQPRSSRRWPFPTIQQPPEVGDGWVRFVQTAGGRTGLPAPRRVRRRPFIQWQAPLVWSTLSLTLHADGPPEFEVLGASRFPRHWFYDGEGTWRPSRGSPTSRTGTASRSAGTPRGATRTPRRWSPRSRPPSSGPCRPR